MALARPPEGLFPEPRGHLAPEEAARRFASAGFLDPPAAWAVFREGLGALPYSSPFLSSLEETWVTLSRAADPDLALRTLTRWIEGGGEDAAPGPRARLWARSAELREALLLLAGASPALALEIERLGEEFSPRLWVRGWETPASLGERLRPLLALPMEESGRLHGSGQEGFARAIGRFRRRETLRIAYLDECRRLPVDEVTLQISFLADAVIAAVLERSRAEMERRLGLPPSPAGAAGFSVLAMGKLGSLELNYSSDIDLIFISGEDGGPAGLAPDAREGFFTRLAERLIAGLSSFTDEGQPYRVDARLRPGGSAGKLVWPAQAALDYYQTEGRPWERQALIRLRHVAGDEALSRSFLEALDPFVFRSSLSAEDLEELRGLKTQVERLAALRGETETHVKIGRGGIRDVEYIVQYLQLLDGGSRPALKEGNVFRVLEALEKERVLNTDETDSLRRGYRFLRQVEHRIQLNYLRQTHQLPEDPADLRRIARGLGHEGAASFRERLAAHSARIRRVYRRLFEGARPPEEEEERLRALLDLPLAAVAGAAREYLEPFGFRDPEVTLATLRRLAGEESAAWDQARAREVFRRLAPRLLREISQYPDPDRTLANFDHCVSTLGARSVFYGLLHDSEEALLLVLEIAGRSTYIIEVLRAYPTLFDEVIDLVLTGGGLDAASLAAEEQELVRRADEPEAWFEFKYLHFLLVAFRDLDRTLNLMNATHHLSGAADVVLRAALAALRPEASKHGRAAALPAGEAPRALPDARPPLEILVLAVGKLGGEELNYRSDLDIVFLYRAPPAGEAVEAALAQEEAHRAAQEVLNRLCLRDPLGPLFKTDVRLRPMGSKNLLAVSFEEFRRYFEEGIARTWERQAFLRARPVAGSPALAREAMEFIHARMPLREDEDPGAVKREVAEMRRKLEEAAGRGDFIKRGRGGVVDVEFLVQTLQLIHGRERPEVLAANTPLAVQRLEAAGIIAPATAAELLTAYQFLRWLEMRLSLLMAPEESLQSMDRERLRSLIHRIGYRSTGEVAAEEIFEEELEYHRRQNRRNLEAVLGVKV